MTANDPYMQLARELSTLRREVNGISRGSQGRYRSIENGTLDFNGPDGTLQAQIGQLPDGSTGFLTLAGPAPARPSAPILEPAIGGLNVTWDGTFFEGAAQAGDFRHIEIHASPYSVYVPGSATHRLSMRSAGTVFLILPPDAYTICFVAVTNAKMKSDPSISATETPEQAPTYTEVIAANGKNKVFWRKDDNPPTLADDALIEGDLWFKVDHDNAPHRWDAELADWVEAQLGDDAIAGLNVGKLVSGQIAVGQKIIAGPEFGTHAEMAHDGFRVFRQDPIDNLVDEVIRLGTSTDDYFAVVDRDGDLVASVDVTGQGNFSGVNVNGALTIEGKTLDNIIADNTQSAVGYFETYPPGQPNAGGNYGPIRDRVGVAEVNAYLKPGHRYRLTARYSWSGYDATGSSEHRAQFTYTGPSAPGSTTAPTPTVYSPIVDQQVFPLITPTAWQGQFFESTFVAETEGQHRFLFSVERGASDPAMNIFLIGGNKLILRVEDMGMNVQNAGVLTQGGGTFYQGPPPPPPPPPTQTFVREYKPAGRASYTGAGAHMNWVGNDVYQGYHSSNGDTRGQFWFNLDNITGTVNNVELYLYFRHWYFNAGGTAIINISDQRGIGPNPYKFKGDHHVGGYPKPGGKWITLPGDWFPLFRGTNNDNYNGRATVITLGPGGGTNQTYYGVATDATLKITYTQ